ncbi:hypothetical protein UFOVP1009_38 [uncultured Caudovirales phage]|uniref:Uncharacterized protein n=1 Tax=uncultured Caudovirales phage TaxID=2100421 RepID=A0A6J5Q705_9CAUD|nr:hypothetical protein UFOVP1009_38 [uncultured Caudovirales phage]
MNRDFDERAVQITKLRNAGMTFSSIGEIFKITKQRVEYIFSKEKYTTISRGKRLRQLNELLNQAKELGDEFLVKKYSRKIEKISQHK